jgi:hypothetical protein
MQNKEQIDQRILDDLVYEFINKKRLRIPKYDLPSTPASDAYFVEAARLCAHHDLHPAKYMDIMWEHMGEKMEFFSPAHIRGAGAEKAIKEYFESGKNRDIEITNANLDYSNLWEFHKHSVMQYMRMNIPIKDILIDSSLKFPAWFRILVTENRAPEIIDKFKRIARKELNNALLDFINTNNLDISRITD